MGIQKSIWFFQMLLPSNFRWGQVICQGNHLGSKDRNINWFSSFMYYIPCFHHSIPAAECLLKRSRCLSGQMAVTQVLSFFLEFFLNLELFKLSAVGWENTFRCTYIYLSHFWRMTLQYFVGICVRDTLVPLSLTAHQPSSANFIEACFMPILYLCVDSKSLKILVLTWRSSTV